MIFVVVVISNGEDNVKGSVDGGSDVMIMDGVNGDGKVMIVTE